MLQETFERVRARIVVIPLERAAQRRVRNPTLVMVDNNVIHSRSTVGWMRGFGAGFAESP